MSLNSIIAPEILNDEFYEGLVNIAQKPDVKSILEIGSSSGAGSTQALVEGIQSRSDAEHVRLYCMELSRERYIQLFSTYSTIDFLKAYNLSSVSLSDFPSDAEVACFYNSTKTNLNNYTLETVLGWLHQDKKYIHDLGLDFNGIEFIKSANQIEHFDFVLIDGSEFTGERELQYLWGAKYIALDDVNAFKCFSAFVRLSQHYGYKLIRQNLALRNGYAVFARNF